tara:strand:+ start:1604 stop:2962 length:1359 start_codon:yes stop_codon:yes gene_type:complete
MKKLLILNLFLPFLMADMELDSNNAFISFNQLQMPADKVPIAVKDNIDVKDMITSAGSLALENNLITEDAFLVTKLKQNNYFIIGKTNLSEWANFRSTGSVSGWSSLGGQTLNSYGRNLNPCGSSSGSAVAVKDGLVEVAIGTETNGSISCPASVNGIVGIKPTVGLVSRHGIVPISSTQDTAGPMTKNVALAAQVLSVISGFDPKDKATYNIPSTMTFNFADDLSLDGLKNKRLGLLVSGQEYEIGQKLLDKIKNTIAALGGEVVMIEDNREYPGNDEYFLLLYEFKYGIDKYLQSKKNLNVSSLYDLIKFNEANKDEVMQYFDQDIFYQSEEASLDQERYEDAKEIVIEAQNDIQYLLNQNNLDALVGLTRNPAWEINYVGGDNKAMDKQLSWGNGGFAAIAGFPHITVPLSLVNGLPVGVSFIGSAWSEKSLLEMAYAFEQFNQVGEIE